MLGHHLSQPELQSRPSLSLQLRQWCLSLPVLISSLYRPPWVVWPAVPWGSSCDEHETPSKYVDGQKSQGHSSGEWHHSEYRKFIDSLHTQDISMCMPKTPHWGYPTINSDTDSFNQANLIDRDLLSTSDTHFSHYSIAFKQEGMPSQLNYYPNSTHNYASFSECLLKFKKKRWKKWLVTRS